MGALINLNGINKIYYNGVEIKTVYANNNVVYQNDGIDRSYNHFIFDTTKVEGGAPVTITLANYRAGDETEWDGLTDWGDGVIDNKQSHTYRTNGEYEVKTKWMINRKIGFESYSADTNTKNALVACRNINKNITDATFLFYGCTSLKSVDMSRFKANNITDMMAMFKNCIVLEDLNMRGWDTSNVTKMKQMFYNCKKLTPKVAHFNVSNVTNFYDMFYSCGAIDGSQFKNWKISSDMPVIMYGMFCGSTVTTNCLDLSEWNMSRVTSLVSMFEWCCAYEGIDISYWNIRNDAYVASMFYRVHCKDCTTLEPHDIEKHIKHVGVPNADWELMK